LSVNSLEGSKLDAEALAGTASTAPSTITVTALSLRFVPPP
jgi:hypothetical protein